MEKVHLHFKTIDSTNTWSKNNLETFERDKLTIVSADEQTAARGRFNRHWLAPPWVNLYTTFNFFIQNANFINNIPQVLALSTIGTLKEVEVISQLKWPNDILISGKKVAGILCETVCSEDEIGVILGIGLNINMTLDQIHKIDRPVTSLFIEKGIAFDVKAIQNRLENIFHQNLKSLFENGFNFFYENLKDCLFHKKGDPIQFHNKDKICKGNFESINPDGTIRIKLLSGEICNYNSLELLP